MTAYHLSELCGIREQLNYVFLPWSYEFMFSWTREEPGYIEYSGLRILRHCLRKCVIGRERFRKSRVSSLPPSDNRAWCIVLFQLAFNVSNRYYYLESNSRISVYSTLQGIFHISGYAHPLLPIRLIPISRSPTPSKFKLITGSVSHFHTWSDGEPEDACPRIIPTTAMTSFRETGRPFSTEPIFSGPSFWKFIIYLLERSTVYCFVGKAVFEFWGREK